MLVPVCLAPVVIYTIFALAAAICSFTVLPSLRLHQEFRHSCAKNPSGIAIAELLWTF